MTKRNLLYIIILIGIFFSNVQALDIKIKLKENDNLTNIVQNIHSEAMKMDVSTTKPTEFSYNNFNNKSFKKNNSKKYINNK